jgi:hypothetical protein
MTLKSLTSVHIMLPSVAVWTIRAAIYQRHYELLILQSISGRMNCTLHFVCLQGLPSVSVHILQLTFMDYRVSNWDHLKGDERDVQVFVP